ncbi:MAG TPA: type 4a pilus biogenesis protein PilO [Solirubrobacter sp.]|nr:type 4a pilus biogenesis protein PilO [Solirubrobacter sp.]
MSRTLRILIVAVVAFGAVGGYWKLVLAPKRAQVAELDQQIAVEQAKLAQTQSLIASYKGAKEQYKANYATVARLGKAVPAADDTRSLVVQLDAAAKRSNVSFDSININGSGSTDGASVAPGAINAGAFSAMPFSFSFTGDFSTLGNFFSRLERFVTLKGDEIRVSGRLLRVESIALTPGDDGWPELNAQVGASSYIVPETTEPQATAAGSTSVGSTTPPTSTDTTTTASTGSSAGADAR